MARSAGEAGNFPDLFNSKAFAGSVGPTIQWNILNYGRLMNGVRAQDAIFQQLVANYQSTVLKAQGEVENAMTAYLKGHPGRHKRLAKGVDRRRTKVLTVGNGVLV